jgi:hypothetical protein
LNFTLGGQNNVKNDPYNSYIYILNQFLLYWRIYEPTRTTAMLSRKTCTHY